MHFFEKWFGWAAQNSDGIIWDQDEANHYTRWTFEKSKLQDPSSKAGLWNILSITKAKIHNLQNWKWRKSKKILVKITLFLFCFQRREQVEREVPLLREKISVLKIQISTITKGVPMSKIDVREEKRSVGRSSSPDQKVTSYSLPASGGHQIKSNSFFSGLD